MSVSDDQIALLCAIGEGSYPGNGRARHIDELISEGLIEPAEESAIEHYKLTAKGERLISERGAGLNEA